MKLIVGLGNPGKKYEFTRHNFGFMALDALADKLGLNWREDKKFKSLIAKNGELILLKPQTFMNLSGEAVASALSYYKLLPKKIGFSAAKNADLTDVLTVVHDDIDIDLDKYKIALDSRSAGHNGIQSIIDRLKTKNFTRYRLGVRNEKLAAVGAEKFVLEKFSEAEAKIVKHICEQISSELLK